METGARMVPFGSLAQTESSSRASRGIMRDENSERGGTLGPLAALRRIIPFEPAVASDRLGWVGLEAARYVAAPGSELNPPAMTHDRLVLFARPPEMLDLLYEGVRRHVPPPAGSISVLPAGTPVLWRWTGSFDWLCVFLEPGLVARVAAEAFELDPAGLRLPPLDAQDLPQLRATLLAVDGELLAGGASGRLAAESLANVLAVQLIRHALAPRRLAGGRDGPLPRERLRAVVEYVEEHLDASPTVAQVAAIARLSPYHFARQFKAATGLPPHQYMISRRVERAKHLLQAECEPHAGGGCYALGLLRPERSSPITSSESSASRRGGSESPQDSHKDAASIAKTGDSKPLSIPSQFGVIAPDGAAAPAWMCLASSKQAANRLKG